jgi:hypothetical protein
VKWQIYYEKERREEEQIYYERQPLVGWKEEQIYFE